MYKNIALVVAGGSSKRMGLNIPKQYIKVKHKAILAHTLKAFYDHPQIDAIICVIAPDMEQMYENSVIPHPKLLPVAYGGVTRQESVLKGLEATKKYVPDHVLIHDAARPNVNQVMIDDLISQMQSHDGACPAVAVADSLRYQDGTYIDRKGLFYIQTPQIFHFDKIFDAHQQADNEGKTDFTDDISLGQAYGLQTSFTVGNINNYKITTQQDLDKLMNQFPDIRTANGYDVHRLIAGDGVILGGIKINCPFALKGHSDADVALHAVTDALLGTICAEDIGAHFNPNDPEWSGADSTIFLKDAYNRIVEKGGRVNFIDLTIICEKPKIGLHRLAIRENIAMLLQLPLDRVSVKATTTEKLGFTGRQEGIAVQATATVIMD